MAALMPRSTDAWLRLSSIVLFVAAWQVAASVAQQPLFPGPVVVLANLGKHVASGELPLHLGITLWRVTVSFVVAMAIGTAIGILMGRHRGVDVSLDALLVLGLNIPALVTIILCYIWLGLGELAAITAVVINKVPLVVVTVREGARAVDRSLLDVANVFRLPRGRILAKVYLPQLYPYLMAAARAGLSLIWKIVLVVELLGRSDGVGFKLHTFFQFFDITSILAYTLAFAAVVMLIEGVMMRPLERHLNRWRA